MKKKFGKWKFQPLVPCSSECGLRTGSLGLTWEQVQVQRLGPHPRQSALEPVPCKTHG